MRETAARTEQMLVRVTGTKGVYGRLFARVPILVAFFCLATAILPAQTSVLTQHNDNQRTGQNTKETKLTTSNVNSTQFGKLFGQPVDGQVYAQPLYVQNVLIGGVTHNVVIVATEADSVYAFDADSNAGANASPLWKASLVDSGHGAGSGETPVSSSVSLGCSDLQPQVGISSTPVIDATSGTIYVEAKSTNGTNFIHRLHALDITTGNEKSPGPVVIRATVSGTGDGSSGGQLTFDDSTTAGNVMSRRAHNRAGLLLLNGTIYIGFASHCDNGPYHGWLFAYDAPTLTRKSVYVTTPNGGLGGIWMGGSGIAADANGNIFISSGNGDFDTTNVPAKETGDTVLKFGTANQQLTLLDYFAPQDQQSLFSNDFDLGSGGVLLLPDQPGATPHILVTAGKEGRVYVVNRDQMTTNNSHYCSGCASDPEILGESGSGFTAGVWGMPAYWNNTIYYWGDSGVLHAIPVINGLPNFSSTTNGSASFGFPGATSSISSNGTTAGTGIVWAINSSQYGSPGPGPGPAVLHAFDATNVSHELWNSSQAANNRDRAGNAVKFTVPTVVNGKVYIGTSSELDVYGLLSGGGGTTVPSIISSPLSQTVSVGQSATFSVVATGTTPLTYQWQRNSANISGANSTTYTTPATTSADNGATFRVVVSNSAGSATSNSATLTVSSAPPSINFTSGFASTSGLQLNGSAALSGTRLRITNGGANQAGSFFFATPVNVQAFTTSFSFQLTNPNADGMTFTIQNAGPTALSHSGGGLGYGPDTPGATPGIGKSIAVKLDLYNNAGEGSNSTGQYANGVSPTTPATNVSSINFHSGDVMNATLTYNGTTLSMSVTDPTAKTTFTSSWTVNIPSIVGASTALVGFTGGTGTLTATQDIISWSFSSSVTKTPIIYQTDNLMSTSVSSGPGYRVFDWPGFTNGVGTALDAWATGQFVTITLAVPTAGTYDVKFATKMYNSRGICQLSINGTNLGPAEDEYSLTEQFKEFDLGTVSLGAGNQPFKFTVTGKDAASGYTLAWDYIKLTPQ